MITIYCLQICVRKSVRSIRNFRKQEMTVQQLKEWLKANYSLQSLDRVMVLMKSL